MVWGQFGDGLGLIRMVRGRLGERKRRRKREIRKEFELNRI